MSVAIVWANGVVAETQNGAASYSVMMPWSYWDAP